MANTRSYNRAFSGGVMSPEMFGRIDDVKFQTGAAKLRNFIATPQGPAENRPGFSFVREVKDSAKKVRLILNKKSSINICRLLAAKEIGNTFVAIKYLLILMVLLQKDTISLLVKAMKTLKI